MVRLYLKKEIKSIRFFLSQIEGWVIGSATVRTLFEFRKWYGKMHAPY